MKNSLATFGHKGLVMNSHLPGNPPVLDRTLVQNHIGIDRLVIRPQYRDLKEPLHLAQGGTAGRVHKGMLSMQAQGRILVPNATQAASMEDQEKALRLAFDPYECYRDSPTTDGVYPLSWLEPTLDQANYSSGWMPVTRYVRPVAQPETEWSITDQSYRQWSVGLVAPDPRLYETTLGSGYDVGTVATVVNRGTIPGPLRVTIGMYTTGASNFTINRLGPNLLLNPSFELSGTGWTAGGAGPQYVATDTGSPHTGSKAVNTTAHSGAVMYYVSDTVGVLAGQTYSAGIYARGVAWNPDTTQFEVYVSWFDAVGARIGSDVLAVTGVVGHTETYANFGGAVVAPAGAISGRMFLAHDTAMTEGESIVYDDAVFSRYDAFVLNLSGCANNDVIRVVMETCGPFGAGKSVTKNGVSAFALKTSGPTSWLDVPVGTSVFTLEHVDGITSVLYEWGHTRP